MIRVGIYGGSGYTGLELMRILLRHPEVQVAGLTSRKFKGQPLSDTYPLFEGLTDIAFIDASRRNWLRCPTSFSWQLRTARPWPSHRPFSRPARRWSISPPTSGCAISMSLRNGTTSTRPPTS